MLNPKLILILLVIIAIIAGFFLLQGKFSSFQSSQNSTSQKQSISNNGTLPSEQNSQPAEQGNSESSTVSSSGDGSMADVADDQMITECQRGKFAVGTQDLGGTVILGKEEHEINGQMVEVCCLASIDSGQSLDDVTNKECRNTNKESIGLYKNSEGQFIPSGAFYMKDNQICTVSYDDEGNVTGGGCYNQ